MTNSITNTATLRTENGFVEGRRDGLWAVGPDTESFLQGQLSQDIAAIAPRESRWSLLLHPQGKVCAWLRVTRVDADRFFLDVDSGYGGEVLSRLERFKLRTDCDISAAPFGSLTVIGPSASQVKVTGAEFEIYDELAGVGVVEFFGTDLVAPARPIEAHVVQALRIEAGRPAMGRELDDSTIPASAGIVDQSVSFTKGCYTGQELVARIDSRGSNVPRRLVGVCFESMVGSEVAVEATDLVADDGSVVGHVTSIGDSGVVGATVGLAYAQRSVQVGQLLTVGGYPVQVRDLPVVSG